MFKKLHEKRHLAKIDRDMREFDKNCDEWYSTEGLFGHWENGRRSYHNGCYSIPKGKNHLGVWQLDLYSKDGKYLTTASMTDIYNWNHDFVRVDMLGCMDSYYYDCNGNLIICEGAFITDKETGENLYVIPTYAQNGNYVLYNHKLHKPVCDEKGSLIHFSGFRAATDGDGNKVILGVRTNLEECSGFGKLLEVKEYNEFYYIDFDGNILKKWIEWV